MLFRSVAIQPGTTRPELEVRPFRPLEPVRVLGLDVTPLPVPHGVTTVFGFRVGGLGYVTDGKTLPPGTLEALRGVETLVLNALWWGEPHPTHFNIEEALAAAAAAGPALRRVAARRVTPSFASAIGSSMPTRSRPSPSTI